MPKSSLDKAVRKALLDARSMVEAIAEAETRKRIDRIFETLMGLPIISKRRFNNLNCHCESRFHQDDEATRLTTEITDCFASLAMTIKQLAGNDK
jgi:hypothetical protein